MCVDSSNNTKKKLYSVTYHKEYFLLNGSQLAPCTAILKSKETLCWNVSWVEDLESRAHLMTSFLIFLPHMLCRHFTNFVIIFKVSDEKKLSETTHFSSQMHKNYIIFCLQSYPRQHMLAKCYLNWKIKKKNI